MSLLTPDGRALLDRLAGEDAGPDRALELARSLRGRYPPGLVAEALTQQTLRAAARAKFSRAEQMLFTRPGLEQASSEIMASHTAARYPAAALVADLCCGIGGNLTALGRGRCVIAVDFDFASLEYARHNAGVYAAAGNLAAVCADVADIELGGVDAVFVDPARRSGGRRLGAGRSEPPLDWCLGLARRVPAVGIKAAPGLPRELVPAGWEAEFVAVGRDLKEALLWSPALATAPSRATVLPSGDTLTAQPGVRGADVPVAEPGAFLLDPSPAVTRAGLVAELARRLGAWKIDHQIAFLSAGRELTSPFARTLRVLESAPWHERQFARKLRDLGIGAADIRRRGLAGDVPQIHRRLALRGPGRATVVITRVSGRPWGLICADIAGPSNDPDAAT
ncbi:MAG TPA: class I SAM-dependent methyltransferase [Streptosporangiaceae bacterium]|nr:class I SAM-dependent methyltransferase [Streptosporangiaceae bacterium]